VLFLPKKLADGLPPQECMLYSLHAQPVLFEEWMLMVSISFFMECIKVIGVGPFNTGLGIRE